MALPASGAISLSQVNVELGLSATATISLNQANVRTLAGVSSGAISMQDLRGKANQFSFTISSNQTNANLRTLAINAGWNQSVKLVATINSGIVCSSNSTGTPGLTVNGSYPGGVELTNNGFIIGMGGAGGRGVDGSGVQPVGVGGTNGASGGLALSVSSAISLRNNGTIGGGGGGGAGGRAIFGQGYSGFVGASGGGGGGGRSGAAANSAGGSAGGGPFPTFGFTASNGGAGTFASAGAGGAGAFTGTEFGTSGTGGGGGNFGSAGSSATNNQANSGPTLSPGGGGAAISGNGNITYLATGTRLGAIT